MSADNFYLIRKHPLGGYAAVMGFASTDWEHENCDDLDCDERDHLAVGENMEQFSTVEEALFWAVGEYSEYGVSVHPECEEEQVKS